LRDIASLESARRDASENICEVLDVFERSDGDAFIASHTPGFKSAHSQQKLNSWTAK
jgi:hypothetical protein